jgi:endonuclease G
MRLPFAVLLLPVLCLLSGCPAEPPAPAPTQAPRAVSQTGNAGNTGDNTSLLLGNPSRAGRNADDLNNRLLERPQHAMSYNATLGGPNWVAWHLEESDLGETDRSSFRPDPLLPPQQQIRPTDYKGSGYDRGHVCPSGDRTRSAADNAATFVMSNMLPQAPALNQQVWKDLEDKCRDWAREGNELYIVAGGVGSVGRIGKGKVNVPEACWKIIVLLPRGNSDLARIDARTPVFAVLMPNRDESKIANSAWTEHQVRVADLEKFTGYDFLSALPDPVERALEEKAAQAGS